MVVCPACGFESSDQARFCGGCGAPLEAPPPVRETRKTVTVVFCDVTGSTKLGEELDPESLRHVMARYFEAMRGAIERHGGTVEKFIGDAVMSVFGVPVVHEDDALRAVRAAADMREALGGLNVELERDYGTHLEARIGVNTGEVVTGTEERLATGDAVNVAARLEQAAQPGEILLGPETRRLVRDSVEAEELEPLQLKGKQDGVVAYRLVGVSAEAPPRRLGVPMVGRARELRLLEDAWERAVSERSCVLFTLLGPAGVGKSRLTAEFLAGLDASVARGRCLSYGEGITYWPVTEIVLQLGNAGYSTSAAPLAALRGEGVTATSPEEIALAVRRLLEQAAADRPLVVVFDDFHWGEPTFLELVEHVATLSRGAPILLFCVARPELLDRRPSWGGGLLNATTVLLEPLSGGETDQLIESLGGTLSGELAARIRAASEGNPLFVEEMLAMVEEGGGNGDISVPPTVQALLAARLDQLDPAERGVLEHGSVEGQVFHRGAVHALGTDEGELTPRLTALVRKELVRPEQPTFVGDDAYRFRHILIRDAAYDALPKATRAELHERFADWLDQHPDGLVERDEIVGYHLEQAHRYRTELGPVDEAGRVLGRRAAERLADGARTAIMRSDLNAATSLLSRAIELLPLRDRYRLELQPELAGVLLEDGEFERAGELLDEAMASAMEAGDEQLRVRTRLEQLILQSMVGGSRDMTESSLRELAELTSTLERLGDRRGLAFAWAYTSRFLFYAGNCSGAAAALERAIPLAREFRLLREERYWREWGAGGRRFGATPAGEAIALLDEIVADAEREGIPIATTQLLQASLIAMQGRLDEAVARLESAAPVAMELGLVMSGMVGMEGVYVARLAGDPARAEAYARAAWEMYGSIGETGFRSTVGTQLAEVVADQGRLEEAEAILAEVETFVARDDFDPQARLRMVRARILAQRGELAEAERLVREAVGLVDVTDYVDLAGSAHADLAAVLELAGRHDEADAEWRTALGLYERKGNVVLGAQVRARLAT